jgi:hypothetical protein
LCRALDTHHAGVAAGDLQRIALDQRVILLPDPAPGGIVGRAEQVEQRLAVILGFLDIGDIERRQAAGLTPGAVIFRGFIAQFLDRQVGDLIALVQTTEAQIVGGLSDDCEVEAPFDEDRLGDLLPWTARAP